MRKQQRKRRKRNVRLSIIEICMIIQTAIMVINGIETLIENLR